MRPTSAGHAALAAVFLALGTQGAVQGVVTAIWMPIAPDTPLRSVLVYLAAATSIAFGVGGAVRPVTAAASRALLALLTAWLLAFRLPEIVKAPLTILPWDGAAETLGVTAGVLIVALRVATRAHDRLATGIARARATTAARALYGAALLPFGLVHFAFVTETVSLVPAWLPWPTVFAYFTGGAFVAAGIAILTGIAARLAAFLSAAQMGLFTALVWVPIVVRGAATSYQWSELALSFALAASGLLVAESYAARPPVEPPADASSTAG